MAPYAPVPRRRPPHRFRPPHADAEPHRATPARTTSVVSFAMGKVRTDPSRLEIEVRCRDEAQLASLTGLLVNQGCYEKEVEEALLRPAPQDSCVPDDFYATTNRRTQVFRGALAGRGGHADGRRHRGAAGRAASAG